MLAGILHQNGLLMGDDLLGASYSNPYGHFEDKRVIAINDRLLNAQGGQWYNDHAVTSFFSEDAVENIQNYVQTRLIHENEIGFKDPRLMATLRTWTLAIPSLRIIYIHRGFNRSCYSFWLRAYNDYKQSKAQRLNKMIVESKTAVIELYLNNVMNFMSFLLTDRDLQERTAFIDYDSLLDNSVDLGAVLKRLGISLTEVKVEDYVDSTAVTADRGFQGPMGSEVIERARAVDAYIMKRCVQK